MLRTQHRVVLCYLCLFVKKKKKNLCYSCLILIDIKLCRTANTIAAKTTTTGIHTWKKKTKKKLGRGPLIRDGIFEINIMFYPIISARRKRPSMAFYFIRYFVRLMILRIIHPERFADEFNSLNRNFPTVLCLSCFSIDFVLSAFHEYQIFFYKNN